MDNIPSRSTDSSQRSQATEHAQSTHAPQPNHSVSGPKRKKLHRLKRLFIALVVVIAIAGLVVFGLVLSRQFSGGTAIDSSKYQAVFLSNGQVYFGKLQNSTGEYLKLTNVFYLQTTAETTTQNPQTTTNATNNVELVKLGSEIHGPEDQMLINQSEVLFYENLKPDGRVSQSITNYVKR